ncbi:MAG: hypothetical protein CIT03_05845 [Methanobacterium sp.]|nr:MAG: hypothetical protein CIT03_05845 [Methanobacterium sp.]
MRIYALALKNMRRNKIRNVSTILRISFGVIFLLILLSSGIGINSFLDQAQSYTQNDLNDSVNNTSSTNLSSTLSSFLNSTLGVNSEDSSLIFLKNIFKIIIYILDGIASIGLLIGVLGVLTTMYFNEVERRREVGLLKLMGFNKNQILLSFALEAALLGFIASLIGVILGSLGLFVITDIFKFISLHIILPWWLIVFSILITTLLSFILGIYPAWLASKNNVSVVLRNG